MNGHWRITVLTWMGVCGLASPALSQSRQIALQQALDKPVNVSIPDAPVGDVFSELTKQTGVRFEIDPMTLDLLPYGEQTRLKVTLKNITLRKALSRMLAAQALQWSIDREAVRIHPGEVLGRACRRATYDELTLLGIMHTERLLPTSKGGSVIEQLRKITQNKDLDVSFEVTTDEKAAVARAERALPGTAAQWFDALCRNQFWTWYLWGDEIKIVSCRKQIERQLQRQVSLEYKDAKLVTVLLDLARKARVKLEMEPGVLENLAPEAKEHFHLVMADAAIGQALEVISGATGLEFVVTDTGIQVTPSEELKQRSAATQPRKRSAFFVRLSLPGPNGTTVEVFLRSDELPDDVVESIQAEKERLIESLRSAVTTQKSAP
ncbi:MAG TPA: hypothetical protein VMZ50_08775 [Phycisphaerae bacterium]|nr:hypothetical protein [Phycisphaerae bacterium]